MKASMKIRVAVLLRPNELPEPLIPSNGIAFTVTELQEIIGGNLEVVRPLLKWEKGNDVMVVDEDRKSKNLEPNAMATLIYGNSDDFIVGTAVILHRDFLE